MLKSSLCLLFTAMLASAVFAVPQPGHTDVQSLQYEFGRGVSDKVVSVTTPTAPVSRVKPAVVYAPVDRGCCCSPCCVPVRCGSPACTVCRPCYTPCRSPLLPRRIFVRPVYYSPYSYDCGCR